MKDKKKIARNLIFIIEEMFFVLIAGLTPGLVARLELNIQGAPGRSCDYFCFVFSQVDVVALLILEIDILDLLISLTGSGLKSVVGKCNIIQIANWTSTAG